MLKELIETSRGWDHDILQGFNEAQSFIVNPKPCYTALLEMVRRSAYDRWADTTIGWDDITAWVSEGCPEPLSNNITLPPSQGSEQFVAKRVLEVSMELVDLRVFVPHTGVDSGRYR